MARIRLGMVGGGKDALIGEVHRLGARLDGQFDLVAGALSSTPEKSLESGLALGLDPGRCYGSFAEMARAEAARPDGIEAVVIVTPNHVHAAAASAFLAEGIHVICDKPLAATMEQAGMLADAVQDSAALFILTHNYTAYPMIREARAMIARGDLGPLRVVQAEYAQDWLTRDSTGKQADWRGDPARAGIGGAVGDIGTHAFNLAGFVTGLRAEALSADLQSFVPGRRVDDNGHVMLRYGGGVRGMLWFSQVAVGCGNGLRLRVFGAEAGIEWSQEEPELLWYTRFGEPRQRLTRAGPGTGPAGLSRTPSGHPEGYIEAFANLYTEAAAAIRAARAGNGRDIGLLPGLKEGLEGMQFIAACVESSAQDGRWLPLDPVTAP
ncbi:gfo/Idh/MocA family oxidoreductase [Pseudooceanicola sp. GBMRC 2024]|uniref:Gfo/Idh/MocA family oxidoreductase n=2 Tax=Paracoccaceae TaxID=31989 RepID=A0A6L7G4V0_9RHOB|nr:gfo/Idh/MocA family oxidoreductase [Pseudooceanicola albus]